MGRIKNKEDRYPIKPNIAITDFVIGTDSEDNDKTVNFKLSDIMGIVPFLGSPFVDISYGWSKTGDAIDPIEFIRTDTVEDIDGSSFSPIPTRVSKLIVDIPNYEALKEFNPTLLIDRYRHTQKINNLAYRKSGYKHAEQYHATLSNRPNEFPLTEVRNIIDMNLENYFKFDSKRVSVKGLGGRNSTSKSTGIYPRYNKSWFFMSARMRVTIGGKVIETPPLVCLKAISELYNIISTDINDINWQSRFRFEFT